MGKFDPVEDACANIPGQQAHAGATAPDAGSSVPAHLCMIVVVVDWLALLLMEFA